MLSQREIDEYGRVVEALQAEADVQSMEGNAPLAGLLVRARQCLRAALTKAIELQRLAEETDAILSLPPERPNGVTASCLS